MNHRHLLPNEIDLLVDGESGFGVAPLRAHLDECTECRGRYEGLRSLSGSIESLPHFTPKLRFADDVMAKVQVIEPWHVALVEAARRFVPRSAPMRVLAGAGAGAMAVAVSGGALWLAFRADLATFAFSIFADRSRQTLVSGAGEVAASALGSEATAAIASGGATSLLLTSGILALVAIGAALGFRRLAATARATRG
jgi:anti-sigma factor RsiW